MPARWIPLALPPILAALLAAIAGAVVLGSDDGVTAANRAKRTTRARPATRPAPEARPRPAPRVEQPRLEPPARPAAVAPPVARPVEAAPVRAPVPDAVLVALLRASQSADAGLRGAAASALGSAWVDAGPLRPRVSGVLEGLLLDPSPDVAASAARALAPVPGAVPALQRRLTRGDAPGEVHLACLEALAAAGGPEVVPALLPLTSSAPAVSQAAAWAVMSICQRAAVEPPPDLDPILPEPPPGR